MLKIVTKKESREGLQKGDIITIQRFLKRRMAVYIGVWMGEERVMIQGWRKPKVRKLYKFKKCKIYKGLRKIKLPEFK